MANKLFSLKQWWWRGTRHFSHIRRVLMSFFPSMQHCLQFLLVGRPLPSMSVDTTQWFMQSYLGPSPTPLLMRLFIETVPCCWNICSTSSLRKGRRGSFFPVT